MMRLLLGTLLIARNGRSTRIVRIAVRFIFSMFIAYSNSLQISRFDMCIKNIKIDRNLPRRNNEAV